MTEPTPPLPVPTDRAVLEKLPGAVLVIDEIGTITLATDQAGALVGRTGAEMVGTSVLEYVDPDAAWATAAAMDFAMDGVYGEAFGGPVRISIVSAERTVAVDLWSANRLEDPDMRGLIVLLAPPTAALGIAEAVAAVGAGAPIDEVASAVAGSLAGYPCLADAAVLTAGAEGIEVLATHNVPVALVDGTAGDEPWATVLRTGERASCGPDDMPAGLRDLAGAAGYRSVWAEPAALPGTTGCDVVVAFRRYPVDPTPNELSYLHQAAATLALARLRPATR